MNKEIIMEIHHMGECLRNGLRFSDKDGYTVIQFKCDIQRFIYYFMNKCYKHECYAKYPTVYSCFFDKDLANKCCEAWEECRNDYYDVKKTATAYAILCEQNRGNIK